jgi:hypothetical protein
VLTLYITIIKKDQDLDCSYDLIQNLDRGQLICPHPDIVNVILYVYITVVHLISPEFESKFLKYNDQHNVVINLGLRAIQKYMEIFVDDLKSHKHELLKTN